MLISGPPAEFLPPCSPAEFLPPGSPAEFLPPGPRAEFLQPGSPAATFNLGSPQVEDDPIGPQGMSEEEEYRHNFPQPPQAPDLDEGGKF